MLLKNLGLSCLYVGGGSSPSAPNANPDGPDTIFGIDSCPGNTLNLKGHPGTVGAIAGNGNGWGGNAIGVDCSLGPYATSHCTRTNAPCTTSNDCASGSAGLCNADPRCLFGPPLPVPAASVSTCVLNVFRSDASGSVPDKTTGNSNITLPLASYVFLTGSGQKFCRNGADGMAGPGVPLGLPLGFCTTDANCTDLSGSAGACQLETACPTCLANVPGNMPGDLPEGGFHCVTGLNHGAGCTPVGLKATTADCLPRRGEFIAPLNVDLSPLGTGTTSLTAVQNPARASQFFFCPVGTAGSCAPTTTAGSTCQRTQGAFGNVTARSITESGSPAGNLTDNLAHPVTISAVFCIPATGNALIDGGTGADLPGPGAVSIRGTFQITP